MAKFAVQGAAADVIANNSPLERQSMAVSLSSGVIAGVAAAIVSHPADTLLSLVNKEGAGGEGTIMTRLGRCVVLVSSFFERTLTTTFNI